MINPKAEERRVLLDKRREQLILEINKSAFEPKDLLAELNAVECALSELMFDIDCGMYGRKD